MAYETFVEIDSWCGTMETVGEWGDGLAARAAANAFFRPIAIFRKANPDQKPTVIVPWNHDGSDMIYIELDESCPKGGEHYSPLLRKRCRIKAKTPPSNCFDYDDLMAAGPLLRPPWCMERVGPPVAPPGPLGFRRGPPVGPARYPWALQWALQWASHHPWASTRPCETIR